MSIWSPSFVLVVFVTVFLKKTAAYGFCLTESDCVQEGTTCQQIYDVICSCKPSQPIADALCPTIKTNDTQARKNDNIQDTKFGIAVQSVGWDFYRMGFVGLGLLLMVITFCCFSLWLGLCILNYDIIGLMIKREKRRISNI